MQQTKTTRSKQKPNRALHACHFIACFRTDGRGVGQWGGNSQKKPSRRAAKDQKDSACRNEKEHEPGVNIHVCKL